MRNIVDLIRQGRCTLLSALQQQQARKSHLGRDRIRAYLGARLADHDARVAHLGVRSLGALARGRAVVRAAGQPHAIHGAPSDHTRARPPVCDVLFATADDRLVVAVDDRAALILVRDARPVDAPSTAAPIALPPSYLHLHVRPGGRPLPYMAAASFRDVLSLVAQAALHLYAMNVAVSMARDEMGPEKLAEVRTPRTHAPMNFRMRVSTVMTMIRWSSFTVASVCAR